MTKSNSAIKHKWYPVFWQRWRYILSLAMANEQSPHKQLECHSHYLENKFDHEPRTWPLSLCCCKPHPNNRFNVTANKTAVLERFQFGSLLFYCWIKWRDSNKLWESNTVVLTEQVSYTWRWVASPPFFFYFIFFQMRTLKYTILHINLY